MLEGHIEYPAYIVLDIPVPMEKRIQVLRSRFDEERAGMPAEVTLTGSCGVGTILPGQEISFGRSEVFLPETRKVAHAEAAHVVIFNNERLSVFNRIGEIVRIGKFGCHQFVR